MLTRPFGGLLAAVAACALSGPARAGFLDQPGTRPLGMGGALRGHATGDAGPTMNPSGMSLLRGYTLEGAYQYASHLGAHALHASVVDSTSGFNLAGGVYYNFVDASPETGGDASAHEVGVALSFPLSDHLFIGGTTKWLRDRLAFGDRDNLEQGLTFDLGLTARVNALSFGIVGHNLVDQNTSRAPTALGLGVAFGGLADLLLAFDAVFDFTKDDPTRATLIHLQGGAEYVFGGSIGVRAGGGRDARGERGYVTGGFSLLSPLGAVDAGVRQDVGGQRKETVAAVSLRLFVPTP